MKIVYKKEEYKKYEGKLPFPASLDQCNSTLKILLKNGDIEDFVIKEADKICEVKIIAHTAETKKALDLREESISLARNGLINNSVKGIFSRNIENPYKKDYRKK